MKNKMKFALSILAAAVALKANAADCRIGAYLSDGSITRVTAKKYVNCQLNLDRLPVTDDLWIDTSTLTNVTIVGRKPRKHIRLDSLRINNVTLKNRVAAVDIGYSAVAGVTGLQIGDKLTNTGLTQLSFFQPPGLILAV